MNKFTTVDIIDQFYKVSKLQQIANLQQQLQ